jgi:hypothetical protein
MRQQLLPIGVAVGVAVGEAVGVGPGWQVFSCPCPEQIFEQQSILFWQTAGGSRHMPGVGVAVGVAVGEAVGLAVGVGVGVRGRGTRLIVKT